jgi:hypothetical protein
VLPTVASPPGPDALQANNDMALWQLAAMSTLQIEADPDALVNAHAALLRALGELLEAMASRR